MTHSTILLCKKMREVSEFPGKDGLELPLLPTEQGLQARMLPGTTSALLKKSSWSLF